MIDDLYDRREKSNPGKSFSLVGFACLAMIVVATGLQLVIALVTESMYPQWAEQDWYLWAATLVPMYLISVPTGVLILKRVPTERPSEHSLSLGGLMTLLVICVSVMYIGNALGMLVNYLIGNIVGEVGENPLYTYIMDTNIFLTFIFTVLLAPVIEEFVFRRLIIDRTRLYGEGMAILVSALAFALFHLNFYQFFYAFGLGAVFAFIYIRTGRLRYTVFLHMAINLAGSVIAPLLLRSIDLEAFEQLDLANMDVLMRVASDNFLQLLGFGFYFFAVIILFIAGIILLIYKRRSFKLQQVPTGLLPGTRFKTVFVNPGMILFVLICVVLLIYSVF